MTNFWRAVDEERYLKESGEDEDVEWRLVDSKGYPAGWLEEKLNDDGATRIERECIEFKRSEGDEY